MPTLTLNQIDLFLPPDLLHQERCDLGHLRKENQRLRAMSKGTHCPVCDQFCKRYKRAFFSTPCRALIALYRLDANNNLRGKHHGRDIYRMANIKPGVSALQMVGYFQLATYQGAESGFWAITERGRLFVEGKAQVPKYVLLYNDRVLGFDASEMIGVDEALGKHFNYSELMGR